MSSSIITAIVAVGQLATVAGVVWIARSLRQQMAQLAFGQDALNGRLRLRPIPQIGRIKLEPGELLVVEPGAPVTDEYRQALGAQFSKAGIPWGSVAILEGARITVLRRPPTWTSLGEGRVDR